MSETDKDLQKAVDEHLKRLYERYKSNAKVFTATHIGHISLSIVFVLSILFPFLYLQIDARETNSELERLSLSIAQQDQQAAIYRQAMAGLKKVFQAVECLTAWASGASYNFRFLSNISAFSSSSTVFIPMASAGSSIVQATVFLCSLRAMSKMSVR